MLTVVFIVCLLIWCPVLIHQIGRRGLLVLLIWLFVAPVASNLVNNPEANPFFQSPVVEDAIARQEQRGGPKEEEFHVFEGGSSLYRHGGGVRLIDLLEPTRILFAAFLVVFVVWSILKSKWVVGLDRTEIWMCAFTVVLLVNVFLLAKGLVFSLRTASDAFIVPFLGYVFARRLVTSEDSLSRLTRVIGYMGVYLIVISLIERVMSPELFYRVSGPFEHRDLLYVVLIVAFFMVLLDSVRNVDLRKVKQVLPRGVRWFVLYLTPIIIVLTWTRGNWLGFLLGVWVFLFLGHRMINPSRKLATIGLVMMLVPVIVIGVRGLVPQEIVEDRITQEGTVYARFAAWGIVIQEGSKHPIFGIGLNNLRASLYEQRTRFHGAKNLTTAHNCFLSFFVELGVVGLFAYLGIVACIIRNGLNLYRMGTHSQDRWRGIVIIGMMVAYLAPAFFSTILYYPALSHVYVFTAIGGIKGLYGSQHPVRDIQVQRIRRPQLVSSIPVDS